MHQPIPSVEQQIIEDESVLDEVSDAEDSEEEFVYEENEHEASGGKDSKEQFVNEVEVQGDCPSFALRGQNITV